MSKLNFSQIARLEEFLGRPIAHEESTRSDYVQLTSKNMQDIEGLAHGGTTLDAILYLMFLVGEKCNLGEASSFVDNVIKKNLSLEDWLQNYRRPD